ncbi:MAG: hypothetical protein NTW28_10810, partial [Candidatus Solibacter sp.]|nr:hypothetical protein [Candidatus Solibacter sp.]
GTTLLLGFTSTTVNSAYFRHLGIPSLSHPPKKFLRGMDPRCGTLASMSRTTGRPSMLPVRADTVR